MSQLLRSEIRQAISRGDIIIKPYVPEHVGTNSVDLRLGKKLKVYENMVEKNAYGSYVAKDWRRAFNQYTPLFLVDRMVDAYGYELPCLDMKKENKTIDLPDIPDEGMVLMPGVLYLGHTLEYTETHNYIPHIDGRSSVGRLGKSIHVTAGRGDMGFGRDWTLEITVIYPTRVYAGVRVAQIAYFTGEGDHTDEYRGKYQGTRLAHDQVAKGPQGSKLWRDFHTKAELEAIDGQKDAQP